MKKLLSVLLIVALLIPSFSLAMYENLPDVSGYSYLELMYMLGSVKRALWACEEWQQVEVPAGIYTIGEHIPAGHWSICPASGIAYMIIYGSALDKTAAKVDYDSYEWSGWVSGDPEDKTMLPQLDIVLEDGHFLELHGTTYFYPYTDKPDFGFKFKEN